MNKNILKLGLVIVGVLVVSNSALAVTITANGTANTEVDNVKSGFGTASLELTQVGGDFISTPDNADFAFGSADFTIEAWVFFAVNPTGGNSIIVQRAASNWAFQFYQNSTTLLSFAYTTNGSTAIDVDRTWDPAGTTWYHVAFSRSGNTGRFFVDGSQIGTDYDFAGNSIYNSTTTFNVGGQTAVVEGLGGLIDEIRVSNIARYTANFTVETAEFTCADANTVYLVHANGADEGTTFTDDETACGATTKSRRYIIE